MTEVALQCERCGQGIAPGDLACRNCGALTYRPQLHQLAEEAQRLEAYNIPAAAMTWQRALQLLPPDAPQYQAIEQRIGALAAGLAPAGGGGGGGAAPVQGGGPPLQYESRTRVVRPPDPWPVAIAKTG